ncbi:MAG: hypothetical protein JWP12_2178 [Bacteroidetes bacterium]|nr:hypothetical protein [Bacteroidota bacterium]
MKRSGIIIIHLSYWIGYLLLLLFIYSVITAGITGTRLLAGASIMYFKMMLGFALVPGVLSFYVFYGFLFPNYLGRKRIFALFVYGLLTAVMCGLAGEITLSILIGGAGDNFRDKIFPNYQPSEILIAMFLTSVVAVANGIVGLVTRGFITAYADIKLKEDLNKKNYEMELTLIKSQLNPHFLFNTINNIDVLIGLDAAKASVYLNKLSDIMRFMLYETKSEQIPLAQELLYIEKYIDLQKIRTANPDYVIYTMNGNAGSNMIAPMIFIPFIENAFKHAENKKTENAIKIVVTVEKNKIIFECENAYPEHKQETPGQGGLGNGLIRKRIELVYPGRHTLEVTDEHHIYKIKLTLTKDEL